MSNETWPARRWLDRDLVVGAAVTVLAGLVRVAFIASTPASAPLSDMAEYWERALYLFQHGQLYPDSWRMPGLPVALSAAFITAGHASLEAARGLNVLAGMMAAGLTYALARRSAPRGWAVGAAAIVAVYPSLIVYSSLVATESLVIVPILGALVAATYPTRRGAWALGALMGVAVLIRPASVALLPAAVAAGLYSPPRGGGDRRGRCRVGPRAQRGDCAARGLPSPPARCVSACSRGGGTTTTFTARSYRSTRPAG